MKELLPRVLSRRDLLKRVGLAGAAVGVPVTGVIETTASATAVQAPAQTATPTAREARETLTTVEAETLEAIVARLIPTDEHGPGAAEARAAHYIDRALGGALASSRDAYAAGLEALDAYAQASRGARFSRLPAADQDGVLRDVENDVATGFRPNASSFFNLVRDHTIQGTFCDPYYGGNANFVGWDLLGYPGVRLAVSEAEQKLVAPRPNHKSAYDYAMFQKG
jgi:gluconate 2-dehydrogenase gamma chain